MDPDGRHDITSWSRKRRFAKWGGGGGVVGREQSVELILKKSQDTEKDTRIGWLDEFVHKRILDAKRG